MNRKPRDEPEGTGHVVNPVTRINFLHHDSGIVRQGLHAPDVRRLARVLSELNLPLPAVLKCSLVQLALSLHSWSTCPAHQGKTQSRSQGGTSPWTR